MDIVRAFNSNNLHTEIVIKGDANNPLFRASDIGNILDISTIRSVIREFNETEKVVHTMHTLGGTQQVTFLTEKGLYKVLFKSRKPIAEKFQNWVCEVIKEIRLNGIYDLQKELDKQVLALQQLENTKNNEIQEKLAIQKIIEKEKILLKEYAYSGPLVYIIKVKTLENGKYIVKIGHSTKGIHNRYIEHKNKYDECLLLDCFFVDKSGDFENFLHNHESIRLNKVNDLQGHEKDNELFLIGNNLTYQMIISIINGNIKNYNYSVNELLKENEILQMKLEMKLQGNQSNQPNINNDLLSELLKTISTLSNKIDNLEKTNKEIINKLNTQQTKVITGFNNPLTNLGPRVQKIHPETLQLVKIYESVTEVMKEDSSIKRPTINKAVIENTIYNGYRWMLVDRDLDPTIIHNIIPTKLTKAQNLGYIAQLNSEKTSITNVFIDRKTASLLNGYQSSSALDNPVKNYTLANGYYYRLYDDCDDSLRKTFEDKNGLPLLYKNGIGQFDLENNLVREFSCKYDCIRILKISDKTLAKALDKNIPYNNYYFKYIGNKLKYI
jgi:prophage antirepressor-like protein